MEELIFKNDKVHPVTVKHQVCFKKDDETVCGVGHQPFGDVIEVDMEKVLVRPFPPVIEPVEQEPQPEPEPPPPPPQCECGLEAVRAYGLDGRLVNVCQDCYDKVYKE